ncbi:MAG: hypothetical protein ABI781_21375 [Burkholderiales bacterium]
MVAIAVPLKTMHAAAPSPQRPVVVAALAVGQRPAVLRGMNIPAALHSEITLDGVR